MNMKYILDGEGAPVRELARMYFHQSEDWTQRGKQLIANVTQLRTGVGSWRGSAANAYLQQCEMMYNKIQTIASIYQQMSTALNELSEKLYQLHALRNQLQQIHSRMMQIAYTQRTEVIQHDSEYSYLSRAYDDLMLELQQCEPVYESQTETAFQNIKRSIPKIGEITAHFKQMITMSGFFGAGLLPKLSLLSSASSKIGRDKIEALNETIMENQLVIEYYNSHPDALGPNGESAAQMIAQAKALQKEARKQGGTFGVPIIFMHGLSGNKTTFQKMTDYFGGYTKQYQWTEDHKLDPTDIIGRNSDGDNPIIQFMFDDGAMSFQDQTDAFQTMIAKVKEEYGSDQVMVVAHSMGGIVTTKYIEDYGGDDITKLVTLGSPIKGSVPDAVLLDGTAPAMYLIDKWVPAVVELRAGSQEVKDLYANRGNFNQDIDVFSGAGDAHPGMGDGVVTVNSATALKDFAGKGHFTSKIYDDAAHTDLHENMAEIDDTINFLLYGERPNDTKNK